MKIGTCNSVGALVVFLMLFTVGFLSVKEGRDVAVVGVFFLIVSIIPLAFLVYGFYLEHLKGRKLTIKLSPRKSTSN